MTSESTPSATSSPASEGGVVPSDSRPGQMIDLFGQAVARVSPSVRREVKTGQMIPAIFGQPGHASSASADLTSSLVNRLKQRLPTGGSTLFVMTWSEKDTPSGRRLSRLVASGRPTSDSGCGSRRTPDAMARQGGSPTSSADLDRRMERGNAIPLDSQVFLTSWGTPTSRDHKDSVETPNVPENGLLARQVWQTWWPTPDASMGSGGRVSSDPETRVRGDQLRPETSEEYWRRQSPPDPQQTASWPTPMAGSLATEDYNEAGDTMSGRILLSGAPASGSPAGTENHGSLNPALPRWLQGYPIEWCQAAIRAKRMLKRVARRGSDASVGTETPSSPRSRHGLSKLIRLQKQIEKLKKQMANDL